jgi:hypothetical protein
MPSNQAVATYKVYTSGHYIAASCPNFHNILLQHTIHTFLDGQFLMIQPSLALKASNLLYNEYDSCTTNSPTACVDISIGMPTL